jgi:hypothetical protein
VSQGRVPLSQPKVRKILDTTLMRRHVVITAEAEAALANAAAERLMARVRSVGARAKR